MPSSWNKVRAFTFVAKPNQNWNDEKSHFQLALRIATISTFLLLYLILGGFVFQRLEEPNFQAKCEEMDHSVSNLLLGVLANLTESEDIHEEIDDMYRLFDIFESIRAREKL